jgi:tRNA 2-thiouridine synthesizing protein E
MSFEYNGSNIETDDDGYLISLDDWSEGVADKLAEDEEIQMNNEHWEIINFLRNYYQEYQIAPAVKVLTKAIAKRNDIEKKEASVFTQCFQVFRIIKTKSRIIKNSYLNG